MASVTNVINHFPAAEDGFATATSGAVSSGATTVGLNSLTGYSNGEIIAFIIDPEDNDKAQTFTGVVDTSGSQITGVVWTSGTNQAHDAGATVVDYPSATHVSMVTKGLLVEHNQDGTHSDITADSIDATSAGANLLAAIYPVGSVYINAAVATNPATLLGFGTWTAFGTGRVMVGVDSGQTEFDTLGETGGEKTHTLSVSEIPAHWHDVGFTTADDGAIDVGFVQENGTQPHLGWGSNTDFTNGGARKTIAASGNPGGGSHNNLQPYVTVYMWKRTA